MASLRIKTSPRCFTPDDTEAALLENDPSAKKHKPFLFPQQRRKEAVSCTLLILVSIVGISMITRSYIPSNIEALTTHDSRLLHEQETALPPHGLTSSPSAAKPPISNLYAHTAASHSGDQVLVEFDDALLKLPLELALNFNNSIKAQESGQSSDEKLLKSMGFTELHTRDDFDRFIGQLRQRRLPQSSTYTTQNTTDKEYSSRIKIMVGVVSSCCTELSLARRKGIRESWAALAKTRFPELVDVKFFIAQPTDIEALIAWSPIIQSEIEIYQDVVVVQGQEDYYNLPNKTFKLLKYALTHPAAYTHVLKTDDDTWVRMDKVLESLQLHAPSSKNGATFSAQDTAVDPTGDEIEHDFIEYKMDKVYLGAIEIQAGYLPIRDPSSKWYVDPEVLPDYEIPNRVQYLAGWAYVLSMDVIADVIWQLYMWHSPPAIHPTQTPPLWFQHLKWEDVVLGMLLHEYVGIPPQKHSGFKPAWWSCSPDTVVRHLDVDSPKLLAELAKIEAAGDWDKKAIQCSTGISSSNNERGFVSGDYQSWKVWRDGIAAKGEGKEES